MTTSPEPITVRFGDHSFWVELDEGPLAGLPLKWFPQLLHATTASRDAVSLKRAGLHWEGMEENITVAGLIPDH
jgi:hypothetical protein